MFKQKIIAAFKSKKRLLILLLIVLLLAVIGLLFVKFVKSEKPWSVVYMATSEIYVGKLSHCWFGHGICELSDGYILQTVRTPKPATEEGAEGAEQEFETNFQLLPLKDTIWGPKKVFLNNDQIVFYGPLLESSKAFEAVRDAVK